MNEYVRTMRALSEATALRWFSLGALPADISPPQRLPLAVFVEAELGGRGADHA